jgi:hypothetical protein
MFAMHSHVFGELMDIEPDKRSRPHTTATLIGRVPAKLLITGFLCVETMLVFFSFRDSTITGFLALGALWFVLDATFVWKGRWYSPAEMWLFMWGWNLTAFLIPREYSSGGHQRFGSISKQGNRLMRMLLVEAAQNAVRYDPQMRNEYLHRCHSKPKDVAKAAAKPAPVKCGSWLAPARCDNWR